MELLGLSTLANQERGRSFRGVEFPVFLRFRKVPTLKLSRRQDRPCVGTYGRSIMRRGAKDKVRGTGVLRCRSSQGFYVFKKFHLLNLSRHQDR